MIIICPVGSIVYLFTDYCTKTEIGYYMQSGIIMLYKPCNLEYIKHTNVIKLGKFNCCLSVTVVFSGVLL